MQLMKEIVLINKLAKWTSMELKQKYGAGSNNGLFDDNIHRNL